MPYKTTELVASTETNQKTLTDYVPSSGNQTVDSFLGIVLAVGTVVIILIGTWKKWVGPFVRTNVVQPIQDLKKDTKEVKYEVKNSHTTNLRHEMDSRHDEQMKAINDVAGEVKKIAQSVGFVQADVKDLHEKTDRIKERAALSHKEVMNIREQQNGHEDVHLQLREHDERVEKRISDVSNEVHEINKRLGGE